MTTLVLHHPYLHVVVAIHGTGYRWSVIAKLGLDLLSRGWTAPNEWRDVRTKAVAEAAAREYVLAWEAQNGVRGWSK